MSELNELMKLLYDAGYVIAELHDEYYDKEPSTIRSNQGITLRIIKVRPSKSPLPPP